MMPEPSLPELLPNPPNQVPLEKREHYYRQESPATLRDSREETITRYLRKKQILATSRQGEGGELDPKGEFEKRMCERRLYDPNGVSRKGISRSCWMAPRIVLERVRSLSKGDRKIDPET